ncbi:MAG TPA: hypothetical protein GXX36_09405 [Clostridiaceae bacterium]|nr:hypothetical protein [Clostridiaceae bacterium]
MYKVYTIKRIDKSIANDEIWQTVPEADIEFAPWNQNGYRPKSTAKMFYTEEAFHVLLKSFEKEIKAVYRNMNDPVCKDSCLEFFFCPNPERDRRYMNFEFNPVGTLFLSVGEGRYDRKLLYTNWKEAFCVKTAIRKQTPENNSQPFWSVEFCIPFEFIRSIYGNIEFVSGHKMKGNFYKCGDETKYPHYMCWNNISKSTPDFHVPEFFGELVLE